ncbi:MAG: dihydrodipicolinate synthase family protein [Candidatus Devosia euplotis]|nr:dihydrodipicolinate synthase family protein [Candidatus Devosia euplotis]
MHELFANCQSSEMFFLSDRKSIALTKFVVDRADGRVPVVASGHTGETFNHQVEQLQAIGETGVDSVILISNRLASADESDEKALETLNALTQTVPTHLGLGVYECLHPYNRLLSDAAVEWYAASGRYIFIKDICCNIDTIRRRLKLIEGSSVHLLNANAQTLLETLKAGGHGYSGVMANFHPALYVWLVENWQAEPDKAQTLVKMLTVSALTEYLDYPACAKDCHVGIGTFESRACRTRPIGSYDALHFPTTIAQMQSLAGRCKDLIGLQ